MHKLILLAVLVCTMTGCAVNVIVAPGATFSGNDSVTDSGTRAVLAVPFDSDDGLPLE